MREILFKARLKKLPVWYEGHYYAYSDLDKHFINDDKGETHSIDINTLCQFTGLFDKNGNRIWENDVVKVDNYFDYIVEYDTQNARFMFNAEPLPNKDIGHCGFHLYDKNEIKVIGNKFDNPELLVKEV